MESSSLAVQPCSDPCCEDRLRYDLQVVASLIQTGERVLDLGCGDGELLRCLVATRSVTGRGIELTQEGVLACIRKGLSVRQGDLQEGLSDFPSGSFDTVILSYTIPYMNDPSYVVREMLRVGRRGVVTFPNWGYWYSRLSFLVTGRIPIASSLPQPWDASPRARPLTILDFEGFCRRSHFTITQTLYLKDVGRLKGNFAASLRATSAVYVLK